MSDQQRIIKSLELIKSLIFLEEEGGITAHISKIKEFQLKQVN